MPPPSTSLRGLSRRRPRPQRWTSRWPRQQRPRRSAPHTGRRDTRRHEPSTWPRSYTRSPCSTCVETMISLVSTPLRSRFSGSSQLTLTSSPAPQAPSSPSLDLPHPRLSTNIYHGVAHATPPRTPRCTRLSMRSAQQLTGCRPPTRRRRSLEKRKPSLQSPPPSLATSTPCTSPRPSPRLSHPTSPRPTFRTKTRPARRPPPRRAARREGRSPRRSSSAGPRRTRPERRWRRYPPSLSRGSRRPTRSR
mmetsp:Transcript_42275/g.90208  ORF Transcript_42275/g.90208 Transcript_42275/m.90208 type:complete len:249 (+) Transcript_42275:428-1174(+)